MTVKEFMTLGKLVPDIDMSERLNRLKKPYSVCKVKTPETLNDLNMGELMQLQSITTDSDFIFTPGMVILHLSERKLLKADSEIVLGFSYWVAKEVKRINKLFASTSVPPTPEEKQAGADSLNFGLFGLLDYYAQRMGITNHEEVEKVPWVRVYKCLDMDANRMRYERRLRNIMAKKNESRRKN